MDNRAVLLEHKKSNKYFRMLNSNKCIECDGLGLFEVGEGIRAACPTCRGHGQLGSHYYKKHLSEIRKYSFPKGAHGR